MLVWTCGSGLSLSGHSAGENGPWLPLTESKCPCWSPHPTWEPQPLAQSWSDLRFLMRRHRRDLVPKKRGGGKGERKDKGGERDGKKEKGSSQYSESQRDLGLHPPPPGTPTTGLSISSLSEHKGWASQSFFLSKSSLKIIHGSNQAWTIRETEEHF